jgi:anti-anti-sigma factor
MPQVFALVARKLEPGRCEIDVEGELDLAVADRLLHALEQAAKEHDRILVGLDRCEFIDSSGLAAILTVSNKLRSRGGRLTVHGASNQVLRILTVAGLTDNGLVFESVDDALLSDQEDRSR